MGFQVDIGCSCERGARPRNEDFAATERDVHGSGLVAAIADGVSAGGGGLEAAQSTVMALVQEFFATPATWHVTVALDRLISAQNGWLADHNRRRANCAKPSRPVGERPVAGLTTLTALVLQGHGWTLAHVGDTRAWLLRDGTCVQLTQDHTLDHLDFGAQLTRAIGLDDRVHVDYQQGELRAGDCLLLTSDGVHRSLPLARLAALAADGSAQAAADAIVAAAVAAGSRDNMTALLLRVHALAPERFEDLLRPAEQLPPPRRLKLGDVLDGYTVTALVADTGVHRLVQARDRRSGRLVAIKTLHEARASDPDERAMLAHEAWLGTALMVQAGDQTEASTEGFVAVLPPREPSAFYTVFAWHAGQTLAQWLAAGRRFTVGEVVSGAVQVARALGRLHRLGVIHRDIKPENLHLGVDGHWRILDLGVALSGREPASLRGLHAGTPSYMNPEQWGLDGAEPQAADAGSDLYALGVTLFAWLGVRLPYGEVEPYQTARFRRDPVAPSRLRPDVPIWLDHVLLKAVARDASQRFETAEELLLALERGASRPLPAPGATPLVARDPLLLWKIGLAISLLFNLLLAVWLVALPR